MISKAEKRVVPLWAFVTVLLLLIATLTVLSINLLSQKLLPEPAIRISYDDPNATSVTGIYLYTKSAEGKNYWWTDIYIKNLKTEKISLRIYITACCNATVSRTSAPLSIEPGQIGKATVMFLLLADQVPTSLTIDVKRA